MANFEIFNLITSLNGTKSKPKNLSYIKWKKKDKNIFHSQ